MGMRDLKHFEWKAKYLLGFEAIDHQHLTFVELMDELYDAIQVRAGKPRLLEIYHRLDQHARSHFATEERYFIEFQYDKTDAEEHMADHDIFLRILAIYHNKLQTSDHKDNIQLSFDILDVLEDHLIHHLGDMDKKYVECFQEHGLK